MLYTNKGGQSAYSIPQEFSWFIFFDKLANGDITKFEAIEELTYIFCLNKLALMYHEDKAREEEQKEIERKINRK